MTARFRVAVVASVVGGGSLVAFASPGAVRPSAVDLQDPPRQQTQLNLSMSASGYQPRLGLPDFVVPAGDAALAEAARVVAEVLWADLEFEREFYMIPREQSARIQTSASPQGLPVQEWAQLGADFVLMGIVRRTGDQFEVDLRSIAVRGRDPGSQVFGRKYQGCTTATPRACAHYIADDFHKETRNLDGVAQTRLAFVSNRDGSPLTGRPMLNPASSKEIYVSDYDGANQRRVTANQKLNIKPRWSPDARSLVYTSWESGFQDIYIIHPFGGGPRSRPAAGSEHVHNMLAAWSPDGQRIAYSSNDGGGRSDIWVVNRDGSGKRNLTPNTPRWDDNAPTWSPDGTKIAFTSDRSGTNQIYMMSADGTGVDRIISQAHSDAPTWSPLDYIAFTIGGGPGHDIAAYDVLRKEVRVLTDGLGSNGSPSVAPNGRHIAFTTTRWGREQIATIDYPTGRNIRRVTDAGTNTYPNWSPTPKR
jgi:TolB protein